MFDLIYYVPSGILLGLGVAVILFLVGFGMAFFGATDLLPAAICTMLLAAVLGVTSLIADDVKHDTDFALHNASLHITPPALGLPFYVLTGVVLAFALGLAIWRGCAHDWSQCALFALASSGTCGVIVGSIDLQSDADIWPWLNATLWLAALGSAIWMIIALMRDNRPVPDLIQDGRIVPPSR